jgi:hypothetical protein
LLWGTRAFLARNAPKTAIAKILFARLNRQLEGNDFACYCLPLGLESAVYEKGKHS